METIRVSGQLDTSSVPERLRESTGWFAAGGRMAIDLADVTRADSAGIALLLEWLRQAQAAGTELVFHNPPVQMLAIIDFCALGEVLPLSDATASG